MFGDHSPEPEQEPVSNMARPVTWHPTSSRFSGFSYQISNASASTSSHNLVIPQDSSSYTMSPQYTDGSAVYDPMPMNSDAQYQSATSFSSPSVVEEGQRSQEEVLWPSYIGNSMPMTSGPPSYTTEPTSWLLADYSHQYSQPPQYQAVTTDFLPIQHPGPEQHGTQDEAPNELERQDSKVLVGMGLYDPPGTTTFGFGSEGKSLKLEEEWEPPELPEDDDDVENEADQESSDEEEEEAPEPPKAPEKPWTMQPSVVPPSSNMAGQSFFFDDDDTITNEWWYQQLKQPTAQDAGIGYGWLQNV